MSHERSKIQVVNNNFKTWTHMNTTKAPGHQGHQGYQGVLHRLHDLEGQLAAAEVNLLVVDLYGAKVDVTKRPMVDDLTQHLFC